MQEPLQDLLLSQQGFDFQEGVRGPFWKTLSGKATLGNLQA